MKENITQLEYKGYKDLITLNPTDNRFWGKICTPENPLTPMDYCGFAGNDIEEARKRFHSQVEKILSYKHFEERRQEWKSNTDYKSVRCVMNILPNEFEQSIERGFFEIDMKYINRDSFLGDIMADLQLLKDIRNEWFVEKHVTVNGNPVVTFEMKFDYKLNAFCKLLKEQREKDPARKIIVFTEFADMANYLGEALAHEGLGVFKYTSKEASTTNKAIIRANFDAGLKPQYQKNDYQVLIATDAISEGYNLHRAGTIFNYDIPYNPTRVIQRIGRINRINKKMFEKLYIYNYFPTDIGEARGTSSS